ncbi:MAG: hypothetical protein RRB22_01175 [Gammaproteobacteria bacterium]|nr:hypothetical protein [Gammaproteobacteria bacterium]
MRPLFLPLYTQYFNAYKDGSKTGELRLYGPRWNEKTCTVGREVVLSKGYGKQARMIGKVCFFAKVYGQHLNPENKKAVQAMYGTLDVLIAFIGIEDLKPHA